VLAVVTVVTVMAMVPVHVMTVVVLRADYFSTVNNPRSQTLEHKNFFENKLCKR
jgi:hypothetical protein